MGQQHMMRGQMGGPMGPGGNMQPGMRPVRIKVGYHVDHLKFDTMKAKLD